MLSCNENDEWKGTDVGNAASSPPRTIEERAAITTAEIFREHLEPIFADDLYDSRERLDRRSDDTSTRSSEEEKDAIDVVEPREEARRTCEDTSAYEFTLILPRCDCVASETRPCPR